MNAYASPYAITKTAHAQFVQSEPRLVLARSGSAEYNSFAHYIRRVFQETYDAKIQITYPLLMGLVDDEDQPWAALGIRRAKVGEPLFLERYLGQSAESYLRLALGQCALRRNIAEVGNLASSGRGNILLLLYSMTCFLDHEGVSHILFTGTSSLKRYLHNLGLYPQVLTDADPARLGQTAAEWGSYYATRPKVMVGNVAHRLDVLPRVANTSNVRARCS